MSNVIKDTLSALNSSIPESQRVAIADYNLERLRKALMERLDSPDVRALLEKEPVTIARVDFMVRYKSTFLDVDKPIRTSLTFIEEEEQAPLPGFEPITEELQ